MRKRAFHKCTRRRGRSFWENGEGLEVSKSKSVRKGDVRGEGKGAEEDRFTVKERYPSR